MNEGLSDAIHVYIEREDITINEHWQNEALIVLFLFSYQVTSLTSDGIQQVSSKIVEMNMSIHTLSIFRWKFLSSRGVKRRFLIPKGD